MSATKESAEHLIFMCSKFKNTTHLFEFFDVYKNLYEVFRARNKTRLKQLSAFIKTFKLS